MIDLWKCDVYECFTHYRNILIIETMWIFKLIDVNLFFNFEYMNYVGSTRKVVCEYLEICVPHL